MEDIFKQYGGAILVSVAFTMLAAMLFVFWPVGDGTHGSILDAVGAKSQERMDEHVVDWDAREANGDGHAFDVHAKRSKPQVHVDRHVMERESTTFDDFITITNSDGETWDSSLKSFTDEAGHGSVEVESILDSKGEDIRDAISHGPYYEDYTFMGPDDLVMRLTVTDEDGVRATYKVPIAVDRLPVDK